MIFGSILFRSPSLVGIQVLRPRRMCYFCLSNVLYSKILRGIENWEGGGGGRNKIDTIFPSSDFTKVLALSCSNVIDCIDVFPVMKIRKREQLGVQHPAKCYSSSHIFRPTSIVAGWSTRPFIFF